MDNFMDKLAERYNAGEMIKANSEADAAEMTNLQEQVEAYEAVLQEMRKLNYKNTELTEKMYLLVDESIEKVRTLQIEAGETSGNQEVVSKEMSEAVTGALNEALNNKALLQTISLAQEAEKEYVTNLSDRISVMAEEINKLAMSAENSANGETNAEVGVSPELVESIRTEVQNGTATMQTSVDSVKADVQNVNAVVEAARADVQNVNAAVEAARADVQNVNAAVEATRADVQNINAAIEATRAAIDNMQLSAQPAEAEKSDESKSTILEVYSATEDIKNTVSNLKSANDDTKATLKSALDSAIYGLKQDNREIVEFMQRINTSINAKQVDPDEERKEEEARAKEEETKRALEERIKAVEDFMHKESVKVYRNVQAVINEKNDQQTTNLEAKVKANTAKIGQVKVFAILAVLLSAADIAINVLRILGII